MECPSCYENYDEKNKIPYNLDCGHTFCCYCLNKILENKKECPSCRCIIENDIENLTKNLLAIDLSNQYKDIKNKYELCEKHNNHPLKFYCESCCDYLCCNCLINHSGHNIKKSLYSKDLINRKLKCMNNDILEMKNYIISVKHDLKSFDIKKKLKIKQDKDDLDCYNSKLNNNFKKFCNDFIIDFEDKYEKEIKIKNIEFESIKSNYNRLTNLKKDLLFLKNKIIEDNYNDEDILRKFDNYEEIFNEINIKKEDNLSNNINQFSISINKKENYINDLINYNEKNGKPLILFFGKLNKILCYSILEDTWNTYKLKNESFNFQRFSASIMIHNGNIIICGGEFSKSVVEFNPNTLNITLKANMNYNRTEHSLVLLNDKVFALGGFDKEKNEFLNQCEYFDYKQNKWILIDSMKQAKCGFGACTLGSNKIYVAGGFNGLNRISTIEEYNFKDNLWTIINIELPNLIANGALYSNTDNEIIFLGGGDESNDFNKKVYKIDIIKLKITELTKMFNGKDLRNKLIVFNNNVYIFGGLEESCERYDINKNRWFKIKSYNKFYKNDNLDDWSISLCLKNFDYIKLLKSENEHTISNYTPSVERFSSYEEIEDYAYNAYTNENDDNNNFENYEIFGDNYNDEYGDDNDIRQYLRY